MPDISMCLSENCPKSSQCYRHEASGTKPSMMQGYTSFKPDAVGNCAYYWSNVETKSLSKV